MRMEIKQVLPCLADASKIRVKASLGEDISEILPYLNSVIRSAIYNPNIPSLTFKKNGVMITLYPRETDLAKVSDEEQAREILSWIEGMVEWCYRNRAEIEPCFERRQRLNPLDVYKLLPGTNCGKCGEATCLAFSVKLCLEERNVMQCPELFTGRYAGKRDALLKLLSSAGYMVPSAFLEGDEA